MSMPQFPNHNTILTREEALNSVLTSIAMEEAALSHLINAEGEKVQYAIEYVKKNSTKDNLDKLMKINESAAYTVEVINYIQVVLRNKLRETLKYVPKPCPPICPEPEPQPCPDPVPPCPAPFPPCPQPERPCLPFNPDNFYAPAMQAEPAPVKTPSKPVKPVKKDDPRSSLYSMRHGRVWEFQAIENYIWSCGRALQTVACSGRSSGVSLCGQNGEPMIFLPRGRKYKISFCIEFDSRSHCPSSFEMRIEYGKSGARLKQYNCGADQHSVCVTDSIIWESPCQDDNGFLCLKLLTKMPLNVSKAIITVSEA